VVKEIGSLKERFFLVQVVVLFDQAALRIIS